MGNKRTLPFFNFFRRLRFVPTEKNDHEVDLGLNVPRYPPFLEGLPYHSPQALLSSQKELIDKARYNLGLGEDFDRIVMPVLYKYAQFVHLLPASETHHHRGAGGLLRHGLETALWSAQFALKKVFPYEGPPKYKKTHEERWVLAAFFGGLIHDTGKPLTDMSITSPDGEQSWSPLLESLDNWAVSNNIERYFLHWNKKRKHKEHEKLTMLVFSQVIGSQALNYISEYDRQCLSQLYDAVCGISTQTNLAEIILRADRTSVMQDLKANRISPDEHSYGVPVERYVLDVIRQSISNNVWKVNNFTGEGVVFVSEEGVFIDWNTAANDIGRQLSELRIPGIPRNKDSLADVLIERGYALAHYKIADNNETLRYRYWPLSVELEVKGGVKGNSNFYALRIEEAQLIFGDTVPPLTKKAFVRSDEKAKSESSGTDKSPLGNNMKDEQNYNPAIVDAHITGSSSTANKQQEQNAEQDDVQNALPADFDTLKKKLQETEPEPAPIQYANDTEVASAKQQETDQGEKTFTAIPVISTVPTKGLNTEKVKNPIEPENQNVAEKLISKQQAEQKILKGKGKTDPSILVDEHQTEPKNTTKNYPVEIGQTSEYENHPKASTHIELRDKQLAQSKASMKQVTKQPELAVNPSTMVDEKRKAKEATNKNIATSGNVPKETNSKVSAGKDSLPQDKLAQGMSGVEGVKQGSDKAATHSQKQPLAEQVKAFKQINQAQLLGKISTHKNSSIEKPLATKKPVLQSAGHMINQPDGIPLPKVGKVSSQKTKQETSQKKAAKPATKQPASKKAAKRKRKSKKQVRAIKSAAKKAVAQKQANKKGSNSGVTKQVAAKTATKSAAKKASQAYASKKTTKKAAKTSVERKETSAPDVLAFIAEKMTSGETKWLSDYKQHNNNLCSVKLNGTLSLVTKKFAFEKNRVHALLNTSLQNRNFKVVRDRLYLHKTK